MRYSYSAGSARRRWAYGTSDLGCSAGAWLTVLDTDHGSACSWDAASGLPRFLYSAQVNSHYDAGDGTSSRQQRTRRRADSASDAHALAIVDEMITYSVSLY